MVTSFFSRIQRACIGSAALGVSGVLLAVSPPASSLELELPIAASDIGYSAYGVAPFGYHIADHRQDGHPGLDFEFVPGSKVRAAHGGTLRYHADSRDPTLKSVAIEFSENGVGYQTFYTNIASLEPGIGNGTTVATGQVFGTPATITGRMYGRTVTYAMTHFQLNDHRVTYGLTNPGALSPASYFTPAARAVLASAWQKTQYDQMVCEPFLSSSRGMIPFPVVTRRWLLRDGAHANTIEFTCDYASTANNYIGYRFLDAQGNVFESGTANISPVTGGTSSIDFTVATGGNRRGLISVKDAAMQIAYAAPGAIRPIDLAAASTYATTHATVCMLASDALCFFGNTAPYRAGDLLTLGLELDATRLSGGGGGDLWVALQLPGGSLVFLHPDGQWRAEGKAYASNVSGTQSWMIFDGLTLPPGLAAGYYLVHAALNPAGTALNTNALLGNLASTHLYLLP